MKLYSLVPARSARKKTPALLGLARALLLPLLALAGAWESRAGMLPLANGSFESPGTVFADPRIDAWQKSAQPAWYDDNGGQAPWEQLSGVFLNTAPGSADYLENLDGAQAAFFFALPQVALHQVLSVPGLDPAVPVRYQVGRAYRLTVGVLGGGGGMTNGVTVDLSLQYQDAAGQRSLVARTPVVHSAEAFPTNTRFVDYEVRVPTVRAGDPWAGQPIAVELLSTVAPELAGGYWDFDHVRLEEVIEVPNGSFEGPSTVFADPRIDVWQKSAQPAWYDDNGGQAPWAQLTGVFLNTAPGSADHLENLHLHQGLFLFALPEVSVFQDAEVAADTGLDVRVTAGRSYELRAGVLGGGGGMAEGTTLELRVYYRDLAGARVVLGATVVTNTAVAFPTRTRLEEYTVRIPAVRSGDASVGRPLGIECVSTVSFDRAGGYWDLDDVRLVERREPFLTGARRGEGGFEFVIEGEIGARFEVLASGSLAEPVAGWTSLGTVVNTSGRVGFLDAAPGVLARFYQVRQVP